MTSIKAIKSMNDLYFATFAYHIHIMYKNKDDQDYMTFLEPCMEEGFHTPGCSCEICIGYINHKKYPVEFSKFHNNLRMEMSRGYLSLIEKSYLEIAEIVTNNYYQK